MKKIVILLLSFIIGSLSFAQTTTTTTTPTIVEIKLTELPKSIPAWFKKNMSKATLLRAAKVTEKGTTTFNVLANSHGQNHILVFDKTGNFLGKGDYLMKKNPGTNNTVAPATAQPVKANDAKDVPKK